MVWSEGVACSTVVESGFDTSTVLGRDFGNGRKGMISSNEIIRVAIIATNKAKIISPESTLKILSVIRSNSSFGSFVNLVPPRNSHTAYSVLREKKIEIINVTIRKVIANSSGIIF